MSRLPDHIGEGEELIGGADHIGEEEEHIGEGGAEHIGE